MDGHAAKGTLDKTHGPSTKSTGDPSPFPLSSSSSSYHLLSQFSCCAVSLLRLLWWRSCNWMILKIWTTSDQEERKIINQPGLLIDWLDLECRKWTIEKAAWAGVQLNMWIIFEMSFHLISFPSVLFITLSINYNQTVCVCLFFLFLILIYICPLHLYYVCVCWMRYF